jgi:hypothetical protein
VIMRSLAEEFCLAKPYERYIKVELYLLERFQ